MGFSSYYLFEEKLCLYSKISPGWQSNALQIASNVENRIAFALPFLSMERLAIVIPTFSVSSVTLIFRFASITSIFIIIAIYLGQRPQALLIRLNHFRVSNQQHFAEVFEKHHMQLQ